MSCVSILVLTPLHFGNKMKIRIDAASGSSPDWAFGRYNTPLTYTYEVAPMRGTSNGFVMNPAQIMPNNRAIGTGIRAMIVRARQLGYFPS